ncbi:type II secretion system protein M [Pseudohongiella sp.]|uniref:Type II secretion system protein M n=1 Tax=marine sediment metagenome TaxID=412755 RepID=A0A0F9VJQ0_9ZZZZ|nr:type II secretion system protein M [Pseudohongiella sp.]HDZ10503.1 type II secretion system protein M [Pseudohongiella sp.]HEA63862.1 type II secretion system protein M [Pseudohongiella sp.]
MKVRAWLQLKTPREQLILLAGLSVVLTYLVWLLLWQPMSQARALSAQRVANAEQSLLSVRVLAQELASARASAASGNSGTGGNLAQSLDESASALGLRIASLEPSADNSSVAVRLNDVSMATVLAWLSDVESSGVMSIDALTLSPVQTPGNVTVSLRLRGN